MPGVVALVSVAGPHPRRLMALAALWWSHRRRRWWLSPPFLPRPHPDYLRWRVATAYGSDAAQLDPAEVLAVAEWRRRLLGR